MVNIASKVSGFRGPTVCKVVGISYRQLDYWARTGLATPSVALADGRGTQRLYAFEDLLELALIKKLLDTGVSLQRVREAIDYLRGLGEDLGGVVLISNGMSIFACHDDREVLAILQRGQGVFAIAIDPVLQGLHHAVVAMTPSQPRDSTGVDPAGPHALAAART